MDLATLFENNRLWSQRRRQADPGFFRRLAAQQAPKLLWIGCSDSRVPANEILGLDPGEIFVHRNIANQVHAGDLNCEAVLQYAVETLRVEHVLVCGHYGCGGIGAALGDPLSGSLEQWLAGLRSLRARHAPELEVLEDSRCSDRLCELNVLAGTRAVGEAPAVRAAWNRGQALAVHALIYRLEDGLLHDLGLHLHAAPAPS